MSQNIHRRNNTINAKELDRIPWSGLIALAMAAFVCVLTETVPSGLLIEISKDLSVSESLAGQLVTFYAIGSLVAAIPIVSLTQSWNRRTLLLFCIFGFFIFNTITAFSPWYFLTAIARFFAGVAAGVLWGMAAVYARRLVIEPLKGKAMAVAMVGTPVALALGVPTGTLLGSFVGWRAVFIAMSVLAFILIFWVMRQLPDFSGEKNAKQSLSQVLRLPGIRSNLFIVLTWVLGMNILYIYISPYLVSINLPNAIEIVLFIFGVSSVLGIWIVGMLINRSVRKLIIFSLVGFAIASILIGMGNFFPISIFIGSAIWGLSVGGAATLLQTASAEAAGKSADVAQAMLVTTWNAAISGGGIIGGILIESVGIKIIPWSILVLIAVAFIITTTVSQKNMQRSKTNG
jgi:predicted MFS family arabinose efflux permease